MMYLYGFIMIYIPLIHHFKMFQTSLATHGATRSKPRNQREHRLRPRPSHSRGCTKYPPTDPMVANSQFPGAAKNDTLFPPSLEDNFNTLTLMLYLHVYLICVCVCIFVYIDLFIPIHIYLLIR